MTSEYRHIPVLLPECMKYLNLSEGKTYVDATLGGAGHSLEAAKLIGPTGHLLGIDQDDVARAAASERLAALPDDVRPEVDVLAGNFGELDSLPRSPLSMRFCSTSGFPRCRLTRLLVAFPLRKLALLICGWIRVTKL